MPMLDRTVLTQMHMMPALKFAALLPQLIIKLLVQTLLDHKV